MENYRKVSLIPNGDGCSLCYDVETGERVAVIGPEMTKALQSPPLNHIFTQVGENGIIVTFEVMPKEKHPACPRSRGKCMCSLRHPIP